MEFNAIAMLPARFDRVPDAQLDAILGALATYSPAIGAAVTGHAEVVVTFPATGLSQAACTAQALFAALRPVGLEVVPTEVFDRRNGVRHLPELVGVSEAAQRLGVTRQAVLQRISAGTLPAVRVGSVWAVSAAALAAQEAE